MLLGWIQTSCLLCAGADSQNLAIMKVLEVPVLQRSTWDCSWMSSDGGRNALKPFFELFKLY